MRTFRPRWPDGNGGYRECNKWYFEHRDLNGVVHRFPGFADRTATEELGRKVVRIISLHSAGVALDPTLLESIKRFSPRLRSRLQKFGVLDARQTAGTRQIGELMGEWRKSLQARERTPKQVAQVTSRVWRVLDAAGVKCWNDINAINVERALKAKREAGLSVQSSNHFLSAVRQFIRWVVANGFAVEDPLRVLRPLNPRMDRRLVRRAFEPDELHALLRATAVGPVRQGLTGAERVTLYVLAVESGLRANELRSLRASSFDLATDRPTVKVEAGASKRRRDDVLPLKPETARALQVHLRNHQPWDRAFRLNSSWRAAEMLGEDRDAAGIACTDGRTLDFHSLRHTFISNLARAGVSPRVAQALARHSTPMLTFGVYAHLGSDDERRSLALLPDLSSAGAVIDDSKVPILDRTA
jgi:integrase